MKTPNLRGYRWVLAVTSLTVFLGCLDEGRKINAQNSVPAATGVVDTAGVIEQTEFPDRAGAEAPIPAPKTAVSPAIAEFAKLAQASVGEEVLLAYIQKHPHGFNPTADEILYLNDLGVSDTVITAMVNHKPVFEAVPTAPVVAAAPAPDPNWVANNTVQRETVVEAPYTPPAQVNYFYNSLAPYGSWVDVDGYGSCWRPSVVAVNPDWRPYCDRGRWMYTDCGWYWQSDYSWGWAPFHYGRWQSHSRWGWVWVPGDTWGPAWVSWRHGGGYSGWAPLPPAARFDVGFGFSFHDSNVGISFDFGLSDYAYTFIPAARFCDRNPYRYAVRGAHARNIYHNSTVINNYIRGNNNTIINEGIGRDRIAAATRSEIRKVSLRDMPASTLARTSKGEVLDRESNALTVFRPRPVLATAPVGSRSRQEIGKNGVVADSRSSAGIKSSQSAMRPNPARSGDESVRENRTGKSSRPQGRETDQERHAFPAVGHSTPIPSREDPATGQPSLRSRPSPRSEPAVAARSSTELRKEPLGQSVISQPQVKTEIAKREPTRLETEPLRQKPASPPVVYPGSTVGRENRTTGVQSENEKGRSNPQRVSPSIEGRPLTRPVPANGRESSSVERQAPLRQEISSPEVRSAPATRTPAPQPVYTPPLSRPEPVRPQVSQQPHVQNPPVRSEIQRPYYPPPAQPQSSPSPRAYSPPPQANPQPVYTAPSRPAPSAPQSAAPSRGHEQSGERPSRQDQNRR